MRTLIRRPGGGGFWKHHHRLRKLGVVVNHKRLRRVQQARSLQPDKRRKKKCLPARVQRPLEVPTQPDRTSRWTLCLNQRPALSPPERSRGLEPGSAGYWSGFFAACHAGRGPARAAGQPLRQPGPHPGEQRPRAGGQGLQTRRLGQGIGWRWIPPASPVQHAGTD